MAKHKLDENTRNKRKKRFGSEYSNKITTMQKIGHINGLKLIARVRKGMGRIESKFSKLTTSEIRLRQSLFLSRQSALITDAMIDAIHGINKFESKSLKEKNEIWQEEYSKVIEAMFKFPEVKKTPGLVKYLKGLNKYFVLPQGIFNARKRHWKLIKKVEDKIQQRGQNPSKNFQLEIDKILNKSKTGQNLKVKAMDVCVAASIYADIMEKKDHASWQIHYRSAMELAYNKLKKRPEIIDAIIELR